MTIEKSSLNYHTECDRSFVEWVGGCWGWAIIYAPYHGEGKSHSKRVYRSIFMTNIFMYIKSLPFIAEALKIMVQM